MNLDTITTKQSNFKEELDEIENKFSLHSELVIKEDPCESFQSEAKVSITFSPQLDLVIKQENTAIDPTTVIKSETTECDSLTATQQNIEKIFIKQEIQSDTEELIENFNSEATVFECLDEDNRNAYKCFFCNFSTANSYHLKQHKCIHTQNKLFDCSACTDSFARSVELTKHLLREHAENGLKCCICNYTAANEDNLKVHMNTHKRDTPYKCNRCKYSCREVQKLQKHEEQHATLKCDHCNFKSVSRPSLQQHFKRMHTPVGKKEQYVCKSCYFSTLKEDEFKRHMDMHMSGRKIYRCDKCNYSDRDIALLNEHMKTHLE